MSSVLVIYHYSILRPEDLNSSNRKEAIEQSSFSPHIQIYLKEIQLG